MFDASKNLALKCQPSYFSVNFLDMDELIKFSEILSENHTFSLKKYIWNIVCEMASILSQPQCVKYVFITTKSH